MKSEIQKNTARTDYPCFKEFTNSLNASVIVLFSAPKDGTVVWTSDENFWRLGSHKTSWDDSSDWKIFHGRVILEN